MRLGLGAKFTLTVLTILAATMAANTLYYLNTSNRFYEEQLAERGRALGGLISLVSPEAILGFDYLQLNNYTREVASQQDVVYGVIVNPQGMPISSYVKDTDPLVKKHLGPAKSYDIPLLLEKLSRMPITEWNAKAQGPDIKHIGPTAQDFHAAFGLGGSDDKGISTIDEGGVALAAIQGLNQKLEQKATEIAELKARLERLERLLTDMNGGVK